MITSQSNSNYFLGNQSNDKYKNSQSQYDGKASPYLTKKPSMDITIQKPTSNKSEFRMNNDDPFTDQYANQNKKNTVFSPKEAPSSYTGENYKNPDQNNRSTFLQGGEKEKFKFQDKKEMIEKKEEQNEYDPLKIPADWELARRHAMSRRVSFERERGLETDGKEVETCPCCGYEVQRQDIPYNTNVLELGFLGSGYPLFYNFVMYCIFILFVDFIIQGGFNLMTNVMSGYCEKVFPPNMPADQVCPDKWVLIFSQANKLGYPELILIQENLGVVLILVEMVILLYFRASQRSIDEDIDEINCSPADYTISVKNIPKNLEVDYQKEIKRIFTLYAVPDLPSEQAIIVTKIVLVHDIEEVIKLEMGMDKVIINKQNHLLENNLNFNDERLEEFDEQIEKLEEKIHQVEKKLQSTNENFTGIAFVSFQTEHMKNQVMDANPWSTWERINSFYHNGKLPNLPEDSLAWEGQKLFIEQAPEPNEIDWEFIHICTKVKIKGRVLSNVYTSLFVFACFAILYFISFWKAKLSDKATEEAATGDIDPSTLMKVNILSFIVSWTIVLFNKFVIGKVLHHIVDLEKISNKTKFNISYAQKLTIALFLNTAVLSYIIDIIILKNIIGGGGFIQNESQVFILNALFPPIVWLIDPWTFIKDHQRNSEIQDKSQSVVTQAQANLLYETPDYLQSKRYADIMKTMWFTFLYGTAIPLGIFFSMFGLSIYYYIDKYNLLRRRTIKDNLGKDLSVEMIEFLELILIFEGIGSITMSLTLNGTYYWQDIFILVSSIVYCILPMQEFSEWLFPLTSVEEIKFYQDVQFDFDTDYDRENPVTRRKALAHWRQSVLDKNKKDQQVGHQLHHQIQYNQQNEGYKNFFNH